MDRPEVIHELRTLIDNAAQALAYLAQRDAPNPDTVLTDYRRLTATMERLRQAHGR